MANSMHHMDKHSTPSSPEDVPNVRPVMVDMRPEILMLSSAIRDGLNQAMQPLNTTLEALSRTVIALQHKLHPPSHYGLGSKASTSIDVATPPSAFRQPGCQLRSMSRAPPFPFGAWGTHSSSIPCFCWAWSCTIASSTIPSRARGNRSKAQLAATILFWARHNYRSRPGGY